MIIQLLLQVSLTLIIDNGFLYTIGSNFYGKLGLGNKAIKYSSEPCLVETLTNEKIVHVACGSTHSIAVSERGNAYSWGLGELGALGIEDTTTMYQPTLIKYFTERKLCIVNAACGNSHSLLLTGIFPLILLREW